MTNQRIAIGAMCMFMSYMHTHVTSNNNKIITQKKKRCNLFHSRNIPDIFEYIVFFLRAILCGNLIFSGCDVCSLEYEMKTVSKQMNDYVLPKLLFHTQHERVKGRPTTKKSISCKYKISHILIDNVQLSLLLLLIL